MTPTKVRSAAYRARKKVRDSDALVRLERYAVALRSISAFRSKTGASKPLDQAMDNAWNRAGEYAAGIAKEALGVEP